METTIRIGIVDDHEWFRGALVDLIIRHVQNFTITIEASNGSEFIQKLKMLDDTKHPDIVIMDINMPIMNGFATADWLHINYPGIRVMALSMNNDESSIIRMINFGVAGYLHKNIDGSELIAAIQAVLKEGFYYTGHITPSYVNALENNNIRKTWQSLNLKEREFIKECCSDLKYKEIALNLKISMSTLEDISAKVFSRFEVKTRVGLVLVAIKNGLI